MGKVDIIIVIFTSSLKLLGTRQYHHQRTRFRFAFARKYQENMGIQLEVIILEFLSLASALQVKTGKKNIKEDEIRGRREENEKLKSGNGIFFLIWEFRELL